MYELEVGLREKLFRRVAENLLDGGIDPSEAPLEVGDGDQVRGEMEDAVKLRLRSGPPSGVDSERRRQAGEDQTGDKDDPWQHRCRALRRSLRHDNVESLPSLHECPAVCLSALPR